MKDYKLILIWVDYFNSNISRSEGRRIPLNQSVKNPTLQELVEAEKRVGYDPTFQTAFFPKRPYTPSGYISIVKKKRKNDVLKEISKLLSTVRGERH